MNILCSLILEYLDECKAIEHPGTPKSPRALRIVETSDRIKFRKWITFYHGSNRIILSAPHAGVHTCKTMKSRRGHPGACIEPDHKTNELCKELWERLQTLGVDVSFVCSELHREFVDLNRSNNDQGTNCKLCPEADRVWQFYHGTIEKYIESFRGRPGMFVDLHGQDHPHEKIEVGLFLWSNHLRDLSDGTNLETIQERVSARVGYQKLGLPECVTGVQSFPTILHKHVSRISKRKVESIPHKNHPYPLDGEEYYSGAYCTGKYRKGNKGNMDSFQIESPYYLRDNPFFRKLYVKALANAIIEYSQLLSII